MTETDAQGANAEAQNADATEEAGTTSDNGGQGREPEHFDREYVAGLRSEAARYRHEARTAAAKLQELEDAQKSEAQKAAERAERAEAELAQLRAAEARRDAAAAAGLPAEFADRVQGDSPEAMLEDAKGLAKHLKAAATPPPGSYDNGAAGSGAAGRGSMDALIRGAVNR